MLALSLLGLLLIIGAVAAALLQPLTEKPAPDAAEKPTASPTTSLPAATAPAVTFPTATPDPTALAARATEPVATATPAAGPVASDSFFDPQRFSYAPDFYQPEIQAFLDVQPGPLKDVRFQIGDRSQPFAEVLVGMSNLYSINPQIMLALLEQQSGLLSTAEPSQEQLAWALGFRGENERHRGLYSQFRWGIITLRHALRDYGLGWQTGELPDLKFADDSRMEVSLDEWSLPRYAVARVLAPTTTPEQLPARLDAFLATYTRLFDDPRTVPDDWPEPSAPFLSLPMERPHRVTSFFDHNTPFLHQNGALTAFWGNTEALLSYDGHTGWDYAMRPPDPVLAAAEGRVVFAGNSDDGCRTPARGVIIDHGNGYRTLYWHLHTLDVEAGQQVERGAQVGIAGATGCAFGPHLHLQVQYLGRDIDPYGWCSSETPDPWASNPAGQASDWLWRDMPDPCAEPAPALVVVDDSSPGFLRRGPWEYSSLGYAGGALYTATSGVSSDRQPWHVRPLADTPAVAVWQPDLPRAGSYRVLAYIPYVLNGLDDSNELRYQVRHSDGETEVRIDGEETANYWADLGTYHFEPQDSPRVVVSALAGDEARGLWADAVVWMPVR